MLLAALRLVEPDQHGRVFGHRGQQLQPVAHRMTAKGLVLQPHEVGVLHLLDAGREMAVPEQRQFFLQRTGPFGHALQPPAAQFEQMLLLGLALFALHLAAFFLQFFLFVTARLFEFLVHSPQREKFFHPVRVRPRPFRIGRGVGDFVVIDEGGNRPVRPHLKESFNLRRRAAEPGAIEQMGRGRVAPFLGRQRVQHTIVQTVPVDKRLQRIFTGVGSPALLRFFFNRFREPVCYISRDAGDEKLRD